MPASAKSVPDTATAGSVYAALITEQLVEERARKASIEARGLSVITTSGALVTLLFGLGSLVSGVEGYTLPTVGRWFLLGALGAFLLAAAAGIVANFPLRYREVSVAGLRRLTAPEWWTNAEPAAARRAAEARLNVLERARSTNAFKVNALIAAMVIEVIAVVLVAAAVAVILWP